MSITKVSFSMLQGAPTNVRDFGAVGDGVTDDTAAIQAAIDWVMGIDSNKYGNLYIPAGVYITTDSLTLRNGAIRMYGDPYGSIIKYDGGTSKPIIEKSTNSGGYASAFENLTLDLNQTATHGFYFASVGSFQSIKNMEFNNVYCLNIGDTAIGWQIGDQTNTTLDTDGWNYNFYSCHARGYLGATGWKIDANNAYNISWYNCSAGRAAIGSEMYCWIETVRGSGYCIYNFFGDKLQSTGEPWGIRHGGGSMSVYGLSTEWYRVYYGRSLGQLDSSAYLCSVSVNSDEGNNESSIDTNMKLSLQNCTLASTASGVVYNRGIVASTEFSGENVYIGPTGSYALAAPRRCVLEGMSVGTLLSPLPNSLFDLWKGTALDVAPLGWQKNADGGTLTIQNSTSNAKTGRYTTYINVTVGATPGTASRVAGIAMTGSIPVNQYRGQQIAFFALGTRAATESVQVDFKIDGLLTGVVGGASVITTALSGGLFFCYGFANVPSNAVSATMKVGLEQGTTGEIWLDSVGIVPTQWSEYVPALFVQAQSPNYNGQLDSINTGYLPLGYGGSNVIAFSATAPISGTWAVGDIVFSSSPASGGYVGWVCVGSGSPGTWKTFGAIS